MFEGVFAAVVVTAAFATLAYLLGMVSRSGAVGGFVVGAVIYASLGWQGFAILALFVIGGSALTRLGYRIKRSRGVAEAGGGRRGARNAFANCAVAIFCALAARASHDYEPFAAAFVSSLGAAFADTSESEIGQLLGRAPRLITSMGKVPPGTDGAISLPGTLAGVSAAAITAALALALGLLVGPGAAGFAALAALCGTVVDSILGATVPRLGNELTNFLCTLVAAVIGLFLAA